jgi:hypothetical protein
MIGYGHSADEFIAAILNMGMPYIPGCRVHAAPETIAKKCFMPSCDKLTRHNGGYCCADHCREHRAILRTANKGSSVPPAAAGGG